jgi:DNA (cytosine-5)-methyltransferase 1
VFCNLAKDYANLILAKFNDLFMILEVNDNDRRPRFVQALEDVAVDKVKRQRKCVFTNLNHALLKPSDVNTHAPAYLRTQKEIRDWIFNHGALICRWIYVVELHLNGKSYGGETGLLYKREVDAFVANSPIRSSDVSGPAARLPSPDVIPLDGESETYATNRREDKHPQVELRRSHPQKPKVYTIGDAFCGVGGTSEGARQAGFRVLFGLEKDSLAMQAYKKNFPEAMHLEMCAHDFPNMARRNTHGVDHCHMSCPCQFWSASQ